jgi:hypothetical protein
MVFDVPNYKVYKVIKSDMVYLELYAPLKRRENTNNWKQG